jgi:hypothetical protein
MNDMTYYQPPADERQNYAVQQPAVQVAVQPQAQPAQQQAQQQPSQVVAPYVQQQQLQPPQAQPLPPVAASNQAQSQGDANKKSGIEKYSSVAQSFMGNTQPATMPTGSSDPNVEPVREGQQGTEGVQGLASIIGSFYGMGGMMGGGKGGGGGK